jgi:hypothetical protein
LIFAAAFFIAHGAPRSDWSRATATGLVLFSWIRALLAHGFDLLQPRWRWSPQQAQLLYANLSMVVAPEPWSALPLTLVPFPVESFDWRASPRPFPAALCGILYTLRVGAPWQLALHFFLPLGHFSADGRIFAKPHLRLPGSSPDRCVPLATPDDRDALTLFFARPSLVAIASSQSLLS